MAAGKLMGLDREKLLHAIGSAGTQAAGLWQFLGGRRNEQDPAHPPTVPSAACGRPAWRRWALPLRRTFWRETRACWAP